MRRTKNSIRPPKGAAKGRAIGGNEACGAPGLAGTVREILSGPPAEPGVSIRRTGTLGYLAVNSEAIGKARGAVFSIVSAQPRLA